MFRGCFYDVLLIIVSNVTMISGSKTVTETRVVALMKALSNSKTRGKHGSLLFDSDVSSLIVMNVKLNLV